MFVRTTPSRPRFCKYYTSFVSHCRIYPGRTHPRRKNKTRHVCGGSETWGEMCITSWDSKCNVRTRNAIIMRTRPRSRRDARRACRERRRKTKRHGHVHEPLPGVTHPESASATVLLRGDKFSTGRSLVLHSRNVATQSAEPRIKLAVSLLTGIRKNMSIPNY